MHNKCRGIYGFIFGHKWVALTHKTATKLNGEMLGICAVLSVHSRDDFLSGKNYVCTRCGCVKELQ